MLKFIVLRSYTGSICFKSLGVAYEANSLNLEQGYSGFSEVESAVMY